MLLHLYRGIGSSLIAGCWAASHWRHSFLATCVGARARELEGPRQ